MISWIFPSVAKITVNNVHIGVVDAFYFFSVMMFIHLIFVWKVMPETKGRSLETIQKELGIE
jgi:MFS transporter, SP family, xylose:H+ symportor